MARSADPADIDHPQVREFALQAIWVAQLEEATGVLEEFMTDLTDDEDDEERAGRAPWEADPLEVAWSVVQTTFEEADRELEARVAEWLAQDPEHWPIFRLVVLDPWQEQPGQWREEALGWVRSLGTNTALAHFQQDPYGRQRVIDWKLND